jgi:cell division septation protein DedD
MGLGGTTPSVPTVQAPAKKTVSLPAKPAKKPPAATKTEPAKPVSVAVPPPPPPQKASGKSAEKPASKPAPAPQQQAKVEKAPARSAAQSPAKKTVVAAAPKPAPAQVTKQAEVKPPQPKTAESKTVKAASAPAIKAEKPVAQKQPKPVIAPQQVADGAYALDAGSYLFETNRNALIDKIKKLGYEPLVTPVDATLDMTRLRIGTFNKDDVKEALDFARTIESGSYSAPAGDQYVIYAGTFLSKGNIAKLTESFNDQGIKVYPEPVQVVRTLSRIRFGSFATEKDASSAAALAEKNGVKAVVVKSK